VTTLTRKTGLKEEKRDSLCSARAAETPALVTPSFPLEKALDRRHDVYQNAHRAVLPEQVVNAANAGTQRRSG
jgi:hypothetical protein